MHPVLTVWYNTRCPVCDAGIDMQRNKLVALIKQGKIEFRDINLEPKALAQFGATLEDVRKRLHATDQDGKLLTGADVAIALWKITPGQKVLAKLLDNPVMLPIARIGYDLFAERLYAWNRRKGRW
jgi:predicted DCC family thiol-disulfide oxidoreductase YuxK